MNENADVFSEIQLCANMGESLCVRRCTSFPKLVLIMVVCRIAWWWWHVHGLLRFHGRAKLLLSRLSVTMRLALGCVR